MGGNNFKVYDDGIYKVTNENSLYELAQLILSREAFVEAYHKYIETATAQSTQDSGKMLR